MLAIVALGFLPKTYKNYLTDITVYRMTIPGTFLVLVLGFTCARKLSTGMMDGFGQRVSWARELVFMLNYLPK